MTDTKQAHTPEPWSIVGGAGTAYTLVQVVADNATIADLHDMDMVGEMDANARLIAAAPELLELAQDVLDLDYFSDYELLADKARALIARIQGETP